MPSDDQVREEQIRVHAKELKIKIPDIAEMTGVTVDTVRRHQRDGVFDLRDAVSVVEYVVGHRLIGGLKCRKL